MASTKYFGKKAYCLITGASRGIGKAIAEQITPLLGDGSLIVLAARSVDKLEGLRDQLVKANPTIQVKAERLDLEMATEEDMIQLFSDRQDSFEVAIVVHNGATIDPMDTPLSQHKSIKSLQAYYRLNLTSMFILNSQFLELFDKVPTKLVVQLSSGAAIFPFPSLGLYCTGKAARDMYNKCLASENPSVRVLSYGPGVVDTVLLRELRDNSWHTATADSLKDAYTKETFPVITADMAVEYLVDVLMKDDFENGSHVDFGSSTEGDIERFRSNIDTMRN